MGETIWIFLIIYLLLHVAVSYWVSRFIKTESDYFLGGRNLNLFLASMSMFASWFGAETCMGSASAIFSNGLSGSRADPFGYTICLVAFALLLAGPLRQMELTTLGDLYRLRFSKVVEKLAVLIMIPTSIMWAGAQVRAFGQILAVVSPWDPAIGMTIAAAFVIGYTFLGGLLGDVASDVIQGGILAIGLLILLIICFVALGGPSEALATIQPEQLSLVREGENFWVRIDTWAIPVLGSLVAQEMISRTLATRTTKIARNSSLVGAGLYLSVGLIPVLIGLLGPHIAPEIPATDQFLPLFAQKLLPSGLFIILIGALVSAILSTVDTTILAVSAFVTHNLFGSTFAKFNEKMKLRYSRYIVACTGLIAYLLAITSDSIYELVQEASAFGTAGVLIITLAGVWWRKRGGPLAAASCLVVGVVTTQLFRSLYPIDAPYLASVLLAAVTYFAVAMFESKPDTGWMPKSMTWS